MGGDVEAGFGGLQRILKTADASDFGYVYLVHCTADYVRLSFGIDIQPHLHSSWYPQLASGSAEKKIEPEKLIPSKYTLVAAGSGAPELPAYTTKHKYTDTNLKFDYLKGKDSNRAQYLKNTCAKQGFGLLLVNFEYMVSGGCVCEDHPRYFSHYRRGYNQNDYDDDHSNDYINEAHYHKPKDIDCSDSS
ncbi:hypothetical protein MMC15_002678 [Xylographa vitiligo]|nr:hypothetical protein [Xylographa vitiligo]